MLDWVRTGRDHSKYVIFNIDIRIFHDVIYYVEYYVNISGHLLVAQL